MSIGESHCDRLVLVIFNLGDALVGRRLHLGDALPWRRFLVATLALGVSSPRRRLMLTLSPDVDFDLDFVNARIRDGKGKNNYARHENEEDTKLEKRTLMEMEE